MDNDPKDKFWIRNYSNANVSLRDLGITVPANTSLNLLAHKFGFSFQQLQTSATSGSIFKKKNLIKIVVGPPQEFTVGSKSNWAGGYNRKNLTPMAEGQFNQYEELMGEMDENELSKLLNQTDEDDD